MGPFLLEQEGSTLVLAPGDRLTASPSGSGLVDLSAPASGPAAAEGFDNIALEILWKRLIGIVDEASATLVRASFSTVVRESDDYSIVITDESGRLLAQGTKSIPVFISSLPGTVKHFLRQFGDSGLEEGDVLITNDPWLGTGHLADINLALPIFHAGRLVAFAASTAHAADMGGRSGAQKIPDVFEEGLQIPMLKLARRGEYDETLLAMVRRNVRAPEQVLGDLFGQVRVSGSASACSPCSASGAWGPSPRSPARPSPAPSAPCARRSAPCRRERTGPSSAPTAWRLRSPCAPR